jgi:hypothetical protein
MKYPLATQSEQGRLAFGTLGQVYQEHRKDTQRAEDFNRDWALEGLRSRNDTKRAEAIAKLQHDYRMQEREVSPGAAVPDGKGGWTTPNPITPRQSAGSFTPLPGGGGILDKNSGKVLPLPETVTDIKDAEKKEKAARQQWMDKKAQANMSSDNERALLAEVEKDINRLEFQITAKRPQHLANQSPDTKTTPGERRLLAAELEGLGTSLEAQKELREKHRAELRRYKAIIDAPAPWEQTAADAPGLIPNINSPDAIQGRPSTPALDIYFK